MKLSISMRSYFSPSLSDAQPSPNCRVCWTCKLSPELLTRLPLQLLARLSNEWAWADTRHLQSSSPLFLALSTSPSAGKADAAQREIDKWTCVTEFKWCGLPLACTPTKCAVNPLCFLPLASNSMLQFKMLPSTVPFVHLKSEMSFLSWLWDSSPGCEIGGLHWQAVPTCILFTIPLSTMLQPLCSPFSPLQTPSTWIPQDLCIVLPSVQNIIPPVIYMTCSFISFSFLFLF